MKSPTAHRDVVTPHTPSGDLQTEGHQFRTLRSFPELQRLLVANPQLRSRLHHVYLATLESAPDSDQHTYRRNNCRGRGRGRRRENARGMSRSSWTPEKGFRDGLRRLKKAKELGGFDSEAIHEFFNLALKLNPVLASGPVDHMGMGGHSSAPASEPYH